MSLDTGRVKISEDLVEFSFVKLPRFCPAVLLVFAVLSSLFEWEVVRVLL